LACVPDAAQHNRSANGFMNVNRVGGEETFPTRLCKQNLHTFGTTLNFQLEVCTIGGLASQANQILQLEIAASRNLCRAFRFLRSGVSDLSAPVML
jgi:hypothetical protein